MCQQGRAMAERLLQPSTGPRDRYLCGESPVLSKHGSGIAQERLHRRAVPPL